MVLSDPEPAGVSRREEFVLDIARAGGLTLRTRGECMSPVLRDGEWVRVRARSCYFPGQVVAVDYFDRSIRLHRLVAYRRRQGAWQAITCGDRASSPDAPVEMWRIIGRVEPIVAEPGRLVFSARALLFGWMKVLRALLASSAGRWPKNPSVVS